MATNFLYVNVLACRDSEFLWSLLAADALAQFKKSDSHRVNFFLTWEGSGDYSEFCSLFGLDCKESVINMDLRSSANVVKLVSRLQQRGAVYKQVKDSWTCSGCGELYLHNEGSCRGCGGEIEPGQREVYYFRTESYRKKFIESIHGHWLLPKFQQAALINNILNRSREDVVIGWNKPAGKGKLIGASWFAAMVACLGGCGFFSDEGSFSRDWDGGYVFVPRNRIEYIYLWTTAFFALGVPLPRLVCHGGVKFKDKESGEVSLPILAKSYGSQGLRYVLLSLKPSPGESFLSEDQVISKINHDLANELGNLVSRIVSMLERYSDGLVPKPDILTRTSTDLELREISLQTPELVARGLEVQEPHQAVAAIRRLIAGTNRYIETTAPWQLAGMVEKRSRMNTVLYNLAEALRFIAVTLKPILPGSTESILTQLGVDAREWHTVQNWGIVVPGSRIMPQPPLFPKIEPVRTGLVQQVEAVYPGELNRIHLVAARVVSAERLEGPEGLLQLIVYDGDKRRKVVAPLAPFYDPQCVVGKKVACVVNVKPVEKEGMVVDGQILVVESDGKMLLVALDEQVQEGSRIIWS